MSELQERFNQAVAESKTLSEKPNNMTMLKLYSLYKQGTSGDASGDRPSDMVGGFKFDSWAKLAGMEQEQAMREYIDLVESLK